MLHMMSAFQRGEWGQVKQRTTPANMLRHKSIPIKILGKKGEFFYRLERSNRWRNNLNGLGIIGSWETCKWNMSSLSALVGPLLRVFWCSLKTLLIFLPSLMNGISLPGLITFGMYINICCCCLRKLNVLNGNLKLLCWLVMALVLSKGHPCFMICRGTVLWSKMPGLQPSPGRLEYFTLGYVNKALFLSLLHLLKCTFLLVTSSTYPTCGGHDMISLIELPSRICPGKHSLWSCLSKFALYSQVNRLSVVSLSKWRGQSRAS